MATKKQPKPESLSVEEKMRNWASCNTALQSASEAEALAMLHFEEKNKRRLQLMLRCLAHFNKLRGQRERAELTASVTAE